MATVQTAHPNAVLIRESPMAVTVDVGRKKVKRRKIVD